MTATASHFEALAKALDDATAALDRAKEELHAIEARQITHTIGGMGLRIMAIDVRGITNELHVMRHHVATETKKGAANVNS